MRFIKILKSSLLPSESPFFVSHSSHLSVCDILMINSLQVIKTFAKHYKTLEPIPDDLLQRLSHSKTVCNVSELQAQIFYSALDYTYHTDPTAPGRTTEILADIQSKYYPLPYVEHTVSILFSSQIFRFLILTN